MANEIGKQYTCKKCGIVFVVTKGGKGQIICCGKAMETK